MWVIHTPLTYFFNLPGVNAKKHKNLSDLDLYLVSNYVLE